MKATITGVRCGVILLFMTVSCSTVARTHSDEPNQTLEKPTPPDDREARFVLGPKISMVKHDANDQILLIEFLPALIAPHPTIDLTSPLLADLWPKHTTDRISPCLGKPKLYVRIFHDPPEAGSMQCVTNTTSGTIRIVVSREGEVKLGMGNLIKRLNELYPAYPSEKLDQ